MSEKIEFTDRKNSREDLDRILEAGILTPTAKSLQPQKIYVIESEKN
ncbi:MAG: nitroreductase family protein [Clostridia bacterium]